jgi:hypothetical protein
MTDDDIYELFFLAIDDFPSEHREAAKKWLASHEIAFQVVRELSGDEDEP